MPKVLPGLSRHLLSIVGIASLGGLLFGFDTAVIAGTTHALTKVFALTPGTLGITVSSALWGTILGAAFAGTLSDRFGRRASLRALAALYVLSSLGCVLAWGWYPLLFFRILSGLAIGGSSVISPTYIAEIAPPKLRGRLVGMFQFNIVLGMLLAYLSNFCVGLLKLELTYDWRWEFGVSILPALLFLFSLINIPESPRWLVRRGRVEEAVSVLESTGAANARTEVREIAASLKATEDESRVRLWEWRYRLPIFLAITIGVFNQLSGINAILYYLNSIFEQAGFSQVSSDLQAVVVGLTNMAAVTLAMSVIDKMGRRALLLIGSVGTAFCLLGVALIFQTHRDQQALLWLLVGYIAFFSFSQGAVIWVYISEIFPNRVRAKGQSLGSFSHWAMNAIVSAAFPLVASAWGALPFFFFAGMMTLQFFVVLFLFPETKGIALEEMESAVHAG